MAHDVLIIENYLLWYFLASYQTPPNLFMKGKIAEPVKGELVEEEKADGNRLINLVLSIPNEEYAAKFAELNGVPKTIG